MPDVVVSALASAWLLLWVSVGPPFVRLDNRLMFKVVPAFLGVGLGFITFGRVMGWPV